MSNPDDQFVVRIQPTPQRARNDAGDLVQVGVVYDIKVHDSQNDNILVFSNQGYEDRDFAVAIAKKLFAKALATLEIYDGDGFLESSVDLRTQ